MSKCEHSESRSRKVFGTQCACKTRNVKVYMTDFFLFARSLLGDMLISEWKVFFSKPFFSPRFSRLKA